MTDIQTLVTRILRDLQNSRERRAGRRDARNININKETTIMATKKKATKKAAVKKPAAKKVVKKTAAKKK